MPLWKVEQVMISVFGHCFNTYLHCLIMVEVLECCMTPGSHVGGGSLGQEKQLALGEGPKWRKAPIKNLIKVGWILPQAPP